MHVFGTQFGSAGMLSSISFFIYMRLGGVTYGASWLSWIGIFIKPHELCIRLLIILRSTFDLARTLNCFPFNGMIHILVKLYMCSIYCRRSTCVFAIQKCLEILQLMSKWVSYFFFMFEEHSRHGSPLANYVWVVFFSSPITISIYNRPWLSKSPMTGEQLGL